MRHILRTSMGEIKSFREVRQSALETFDRYGVKKNLEELVEVPLIIREFVETKKDEKGILYLVAAETLGGEKVWYFTRAPWMVKYKEYVPFKVKIVKRKSKRGVGNVFFFEEP